MFKYFIFQVVIYLTIQIEQRTYFQYERPVSFQMRSGENLILKPGYSQGVIEVNARPVFENPSEDQIVKCQKMPSQNQLEYNQQYESQEMGLEKDNKILFMQEIQKDNFELYSNSLKYHLIQIDSENSQKIISAELYSISGVQQENFLSYIEPLKYQEEIFVLGKGKEIYKGSKQKSGAIIMTKLIDLKFQQSISSIKAAYHDDQRIYLLFLTELIILDLDGNTLKQIDRINNNYPNFQDLKIQQDLYLLDFHKGVYKINLKSYEINLIISNEQNQQFEVTFEGNQGMFAISSRQQDGIYKLQEYFYENNEIYLNREFNTVFEIKDIIFTNSFFIYYGSITTIVLKKGIYNKFLVNDEAIRHYYDVNTDKMISSQFNNDQIIVLMRFDSLLIGRIKYEVEYIICKSEQQTGIQNFIGLIKQMQCNIKVVDSFYSACELNQDFSITVTNNKIGSTQGVIYGVIICVPTLLLLFLVVFVVWKRRYNKKMFELQEEISRVTTKTNRTIQNISQNKTFELDSNKK